MLLAQAGFANELVTLKNKHRACQCIAVHVVLKTRSEELRQLRDGLESISLLQFLQMCHSCIKYVFPSVEDVKLSASDIINLIDKGWLSSLIGQEEKVEQHETDPGKGNMLYLQYISLDLTVPPT